MLIVCKHCKNSFTFGQNTIDLEGDVITCSHCKKEWIYESRIHYLESKLADLDIDLNKKEMKINEKNIEYVEKIDQLEKDLKIKKEELFKQKALEDKISIFEKRITETEKLNIQQADLEIQTNELKKEVKKTSDSILVKNIDIEKKTNYIEMKINASMIDDKISEPIAVNDSNNEVVNLKNYDQVEKDKIKVIKSSFFWPRSSDK